MCFRFGNARPEKRPGPDLGTSELDAWPYRLLNTSARDRPPAPSSLPIVPPPRLSTKPCPVPCLPSEPLNPSALFVYNNSTPKQPLPNHPHSPCLLTAIIGCTLHDNGRSHCSSAAPCARTLPQPIAFQVAIATCGSSGRHFLCEFSSHLPTDLRPHYSAVFAATSSHRKPPTAFIPLSCAGGRWFS